MNRRLPIIIILGVLVLALGGGYWLYQGSRSTGTSTETSGAPALPPPPGAPSTAGNDYATPPPGRSVVTIEEFGDYQCPPCGSLHPTLTTIKKEYGDRVRFEFHHFPLIQIHANAHAAASAAVAAGFQGKFWEMHNLLYENQATWSEIPDLQPVAVSFARSIGLDVQRFLTDMKGTRVVSTIATDVEQGMRRGVDSTPTLFINGEKIPFENYAPENLRREVNRRLAAN
jgi:protein-disulfide isomerase